MKKQVLFFVAFAIAALAVNAQKELVPFDQVIRVADQNAQALWGVVNSAEPMAYFSKDDELIGYRFTYAINKPFPEMKWLIAQSKEFAEKGDKQAQWGIGEYGNIFVGARKDIAVVQDYSMALSPQYAVGFKLEEAAASKIDGQIYLKKACFIDFENQWFCFSNGKKDIYVKVFPDTKAVTEEEFHQIVDPLPFFCAKGDFSEEWDKYLNGQLQPGKAQVWIPNHDGNCKFYDWSYGCSPTAAAMLLSYWDYSSIIYANNYAKLVDFYFQRWDGIEWETDYQVPWVNKELAIAMNTDTVVDGGTDRNNIAPGYASVCNTTNGYSFTCTQHDHGTDYAWYFDKIASEVGTNDRPIHISIPNHSECCVAYDAATNEIGVHNTWWDAVQWISRTQLERVYTIVPGGASGAAIELTSPLGDVQYNHNGSGETYYAGDAFEILWSYDYLADSYVRLYYSTNGGYNWTTITSNTPNDGSYVWVVPAGINSSTCRIRAYVYSSANVYSGGDASFGNLKILSGGSLATLTEDAAVTTSTVPDFYQFNHSSYYWGAVGVRPTLNADDWDIRLYDDAAFTDIIASSTYGGSTVDFVVLDGNHISAVNRGIKVNRYSGTSTAKVEFEGGNDQVSLGTALSTSWPAGDVVEMWDLYLSPGTYGVKLDVTSGTANLDIGIFGSTGGNYYQGRSSLLQSSATGGAGGDEFFNITISTGDYYGICVWANDGNSANYTLLAESAGTWNGLADHNWHNPLNWSANVVPDATIDVTIPSGVPNECWIWTANAACKNMTINSGTYLRNYDKTLSINGNLEINGQLMMDYSISSAITQVNGNINWNSGSTAWTADATIISVAGDWNFNAGAAAHLAGGVMFTGSSNSFVRSYDEDCSFYRFGNYKPVGNWVSISNASTAPLTINSSFYLQTDAKTYIYSPFPVIVKGEFYNNGHLYCGDGTMVFDGTTHGIEMNSGDYFNNFTVSSSGNVTLNTDIDVNGSMLIESGALFAVGRTINVGGNWTNTVGTFGFLEGSSSVIFDGSSHQYCYGDNFNIIEINKSVGDLIIPTGSQTLCQVYEWTSGELEVDGGTFIANDLADNGLYGYYYITSDGGLLELHQDANHYVDLHGRIVINNGTMNIYGGSGYSFWPFDANGAIWMSGGVLDFKNAGIYIYNTPSYTLDDNITGGIIRTASGFSGNRADFTPTAGIFELYGPNDVSLTQSNGCTLRNVNIDKDAKDVSVSFDTNPVTDPRDQHIIDPGSKSNSVLLGSNFHITGNLNINSGSLNLNGFELDVDGLTQVYGTLKMNNVADKLYSGTVDYDNLDFYSGSTADLTAGEIYPASWIVPHLGCSFTATTGNTIIFTGNTWASGLGNNDPNTVYGNVVINKSTNRTYLDAIATFPIKLLGNLSINANNIFEMQSLSMVVEGVLDNASTSTILVYYEIKDGKSGKSAVSSKLKSGLPDNGAKGGNLEIDSDYTLNGLLDVGDGTVLLHGGFAISGTGILTIGSGSFVADKVYYASDAWQYIDGTVNLSSGLFEISHNSMRFGPTASTNITGGIVRCGFTFYVNTPGVFDPSGGTTEFTGNDPLCYIQCIGGNWFNNLKINRGSMIELWTDITVKGNMDIVSGPLNSFDVSGFQHNIYVAGHWNNSAGEAAFGEGTGTVFFNGTGALNHQFINANETFYNLENAKSGGGQLNIAGAVAVANNYLANGTNIISGTALNVNGQLNLSLGELGLTASAPVVTVNNFLMGGVLSVTNGSFTCTDVVNNGIFGTIHLYNGSLTLNQDNLQYVDLNANVTINGGTLTINNGDGGSLWGYSSPCNLTMSNGILNFYNNGIFLSNSYPLTESITGGTIRTNGMFYSESSNFTPAGGVAELYGGNDAYVGTLNNSNFYNLLINKSGGDDGASGPNNPITGVSYQAAPDPGDNYSGLSVVNSGRPKMNNDFSKANMVYTSGNLKVIGTTTVDEGTFLVDNYTASCLGNINVNSGGTLAMGDFGILAIENGKTLSVNNGGNLDITGSNVGLAVITHNSGYYNLNIESGGTLGAVYGLFEYMSTNGVNIKSGALVNPVNTLNNCTFQNGKSGGKLLSVENNQTFDILNAVFPANTWAGTYNVSKSVNLGRVTFRNYSGAFSGPAFEYDPNNRIDWFVAQLSANPLVLNVTPPAGSTTFNITSNLSWTVSESSPWFSVAPSSGSNNGTITVTYNQNTSSASRSGDIIISATGVSDVIVTLNQAGATLTVTPASRNVTAPAGSTTFDVGSNTAWTVTESVAWFSVLPISGTGNNTLTVTYSQNTSVTPRSGQITVSSTGLPDVVVTVNQAGAGATLTVLPANRSVAAPAGSTTFSVTSNTGWTVSESVAYLSVLPLSGTGNGTLNVSYGENATGSSRVGNITVTTTGGTPLVVVTVTQASYPTHQISLAAGWHGLSSYIMPVNNNIVDVFAPVLFNFVIAQTMSGVYYPAGPINTIGNWLSQSAYKVKMSGASVLPVIGNEETNKVYNLNSGWNLIPVICNSPVDAALLFGSTNLAIIKDVAGMGILWPAMGINTLGNLLPGLAYYAKMNSAGTITFPANTDEAWKGSLPSYELPAHPWNEISVSPSSHLIALEATGMNGVLPGDVIGVFDAGNYCYGVAEINNLNTNSIITAYANDPLTAVKDGFENFEIMHFILYRPQTNEIFGIEAEYDQKMPNAGSFENEGLSVIVKFKVSPVGISNIFGDEIHIFPNPTDGKVRIEGLVNIHEIQLINAIGENILTLVVGAQESVSFDLSNYQPGIYQVRLIGENGTIIRKVVKK